MIRNTKLIALGTLAALAALGTANAATPAMPAANQATCDALLKQADTSLTAHKSDAKAQAAT